MQRHQNVSNLLQIGKRSIQLVALSTMVAGMPLLVAAPANAAIIISVPSPSDTFAISSPTQSISIAGGNSFTAPIYYEFSYGGGNLNISGSFTDTNNSDALALQLFAAGSAGSLPTQIDMSPFSTTDASSPFNYTASLSETGLLAGNYDVGIGSPGPLDPNSGSITFNNPVNPATVPEPASLAVFVSALAGLSILGFTRKRKQA